MITKPEWQTARRDVLYADRKRITAPPTAEEILAYQQDALNEDDAQRVREALAAYPELANVMAAEFPEDGEAPGIDQQWTRFQREQHHVTPAAKPYAWLAIAATVALAFAGLYWRAEQQRRAFDQPRILSSAPVLQPGGSRGPNDAATRVTAGGAVRLAVHESSDSYRIELRGAARTLWTSDNVRPDDDRTIAVLLPRTLKPGRYELVLFSARGEELGTYALRVSS